MPGTLRKGDNIVNMSSGKRIKVPRLVRMHSDELEDIAEAGRLVCWCCLQFSSKGGEPLSQQSMGGPIA